MTLFINCCPRGESRTEKLARALLKALGEYEELRLYDEPLHPLGRADIAKRDKLLAEKKYDDEMFRYARQFAAADRIVIAAPLWDLSFPAQLKVYLENIYVTGIVTKYSEAGKPVGLFGSYGWDKGGIPNPQFSDVCTEVKTYEELFRVHAPEVADVLEKQAAVTKARKAAEEKENPPVSPVAPQTAAQSVVPASDRETHEVEKEAVNHAEPAKASDVPQPAENTATETSGEDRSGEDYRSTADTHHEEPRQAHSEAQQVASPQLPADVRDGHPEEKPKDRTEAGYQ